MPAPSCGEGCEKDSMLLRLRSDELQASWMHGNRFVSPMFVTRRCTASLRFCRLAAPSCAFRCGTVTARVSSGVAQSAKRYLRSLTHDALQHHRFEQRVDSYSGDTRPRRAKRTFQIRSCGVRRNLTIVLFVAWALFCATVWFFIQGLLRSARSAAKKKFPVGMSMHQATGKLHQPYFISTNIDLQSPWSYLINGDGLVLQFDHDEKLISVQLLTDYK